MKHIIFLLFLPLFAFGQREVTSDSTYISNNAGFWYRVFVINYDDGGQDISKRLIGDTTTLYNQAVDGIRNASTSMAVDIAAVSGYGKRLKTILQESDEIAFKAGKNPADSIENTDAEQFLEAGWTIKSGGTTTDITFNKTNTGRLRYQNVTTTNRQTDLMGAVIRLRDFPTNGTITDLYRNPNGKRWVNSDRSVQLIPPGGTEQTR